MATCFCLRRLQDLLRSLMPVVSLKASIPSFAPKLSSLSQTLASSPSTSSMSATASHFLAQLHVRTQLHALQVAYYALGTATNVYI